MPIGRTVLGEPRLGGRRLALPADRPDRNVRRIARITAGTFLPRTPKQITDTVKLRLRASVLISIRMVHGCDDFDPSSFSFLVIVIVLSVRRERGTITITRTMRTAGPF